MIKTINFNKLSVAATVFAAVLMIIGFNFYTDVSAQTDDVKAVTDVLTWEAQAVEKGDLAVARTVRRKNGVNYVRSRNYKQNNSND